ncbi:alpha-dioxygenase 2 isoform X2 [Capsicum chacoense]
MAFSFSLPAFVHPQLQHVVAKMSVFDRIVWYISWTGLIYGKVNGKKYDTEEFTYRTADGTCNHPVDHLVGSQGTFFGRNMPPSTSSYGICWNLHPVTVATKLFERRKYTDCGCQFNMIACAWVQFMIHDWNDHMEDTKQVELRAPQDVATRCPLKSFKFLKTKKLPTGSPDLKFGHLNSRTPWWDGSVIYGNNEEGMVRVRTFKDGKLSVSGDGLLEHDDKGIPISGDVRNHWAGYSLLQALFVKEHNAICAMLKEHYPEFDDEKLYRHARLITSAVIAKIHTIDFSIEIVKTDTVKAGTRVNWIPMREMIGKEGEKNLSKIGMEQMLVSMGHQSSGAATLWNYPSWMRNLVPHDIDGDDRPELVDMAALDIYRDRERGIPRYNEFRRNLLMVPISKWEDLTDDEEVIDALQEVYGDDTEKLDLQVGLHAEKKIKGFAISETAFNIFLLIASRRLEADRFFTTDFNSRTYTEKGFEWVNKTETLKDVIDRHFPEMTAKYMRCTSAFSLWSSDPDPKHYLPLYLRPAT